MNDSMHKLSNKHVVVRPTNSMVAQSDVHRIGQKTLTVHKQI